MKKKAPILRPYGQPKVVHKVVHSKDYFLTFVMVIICNIFVVGMTAGTYFLVMVESKSNTASVAFATVIFIFGNFLFWYKGLYEPAEVDNVEHIIMEDETK